MHFRDSTPPAPLPGTEPPTRALFIDRWGTLLHKPERGHCRTYDEVNFHTGATDALFRAQQAGWILYLLGNEEAVAFGKLKKSAWQEIEASLLTDLGQLGITIRKTYTCTDHPEGKAPNDKDSVFLLPNTGAFYHAAQHDGVSLRDSWVIGDGSLELAAGWRAGCRLARVGVELDESGGELFVDPHMHLESLAAALHEIVGLHAPHNV